MAGERIRWYGDRYIAGLRQQMVKRMHAATNHLKEATRRNLNMHKTRVQGPSQIGDIPHVDIGTLRDSIFRRVEVTRDQVLGDVGTKLDYGIHHELAGRPFLRPTLKMEESRLQSILVAQGAGQLVIDTSTEAFLGILSAFQGGGG